MFTVGVEEEYHLVDAETFALRSSAGVVATAKRMVGEDAAAEISTSQLEVATPVCQSLAEVRKHLERLRRAASAAASQDACRILAMATHPFSSWQDQRLTEGVRYLELFERWGVLALQQLITGCHVHVGVEDPELAIGVIDRVRPWLPALLALSSSSPFWEGTDTGYASYRTVWFDRFPVTGTPSTLGTRLAFERLVETLRMAGVIEDASHLYWDVRPSIRFPTIEYRVADVCPALDDAVLYAGLARALTRTFAVGAAAGTPFAEVRPEVFRAARWHAAREGLHGRLVLPGEWVLRPADEVVGALLDLVRPALEDEGDWDQVQALAAGVLGRGTAAARYRRLMEETGDLRVVTAAVADETMSG